MDSHGPAADPLSYPSVAARPLLTTGVRRSESAAEAPAESLLSALLQHLCRGHEKHLLKRLNEGVNTQQ